MKSATYLNCSRHPKSISSYFEENVQYKSFPRHRTRQQLFLYMSNTYVYLVWALTAIHLETSKSLKNRVIFDRSDSIIYSNWFDRLSSAIVERQHLLFIFSIGTFPFSSNLALTFLCCEISELKAEKIYEKEI